MNSTSSLSRISRFAAYAVLYALAAVPAPARPVPQNLANGLDKILENNLLTAGTIGVPAPAGNGEATLAYINAYKAALLKEATAFEKLAIKEIVTGKYMVDIMPNGHVSRATLQSQLQTAFPAMNVQHTNDNYAGHGVIEAYIALSDAANIAKFNGVSSVILQLKPVHNVGLVTSMGINQHRINRINQLYNPAAPVNWDGAGIQIGVMSDSFDSSPSAEGQGFSATGDVINGDLPGTPAAAPGSPINTNPNTQPVVVLEDYNPTPGATNEGRAMCQIVADSAPMARIGFATADTGEVGFANNIRALGGLAAYLKDPAVQQGFKGDVVCDDVSYLDEPMFQDGIIAQGVIDVVNAGVTYCSSAANNWGTDGYASTFRPVTGAGATAAIAAAGLDFTGVDPSLYAGGFHNFNPNPGQTDIAQLFNSASDPQAAVFQWNDPYDTSTPTITGNVVPTTNGDSEIGQPDPTVQVNFTAGQEYVITEVASTTAPDNYDAIVEVKDPAGNTIVNQDTGTDETVTLFAPSTGQYTIIFHAFATSSPVGGPGIPTHGHFTYRIDTASGTPRITQDFNLLFFDTSGKFIEAVATNNFANNRPYEVWVPDLSSTASQVQLVICRSNSTAPANAADQLKYVFFGNGLTGIGPAEYNNYLTPVTFGHSAAAGANSVAAYPMYRPNLPEDFTSPGPVTIYFDTNNNRLATPQIRLKPDIAAADGGNTNFFPIAPVPFITDVPWDVDNYPNFYGTSCASPHSAAVAALIIQAHGGPGHLTPQQVKTLMQLNTFPHDLDPYFCSGSATSPNHSGTVTVSVTSDDDTNAGTGSNDPNAWAVSYNGSGYVERIVFNPDGLPGDGGNPTGGNYSGGAGTGTSTEYSDFLNPSNYKFTPGMVFNSNQYVGGTNNDFAGTATFSNPAPPPSTNAFNWTLNVAFTDNSFINGKTFHFDIGRAQQQDASAPQGMTVEPVNTQSNTYSADILGSGVLIPEYADNPTVLPGMAFRAFVKDGTTEYQFDGRLGNAVGKGYSPLDGYGFVNAQAATAAVLPTAGVASRRVHGSAGTFDLPLPLTGPAGVECRVPEPNNSYTLVYTFDRPVANAGTVNIQGTGSVSPAAPGGANPSIATNPNQVVVNLTGVTNQQHLVVTLSNVRDTSGDMLDPVAARMDVLIGDVDGTGRVDGNDVSAVQSHTRQSAAANNYRYDVDATGRIDGNDVSKTQSQTRTGFL